MNDEKIHVFEKAGLGKAPFHFVSYFEGQMHASPNNPNVTSCDYCATAITQCFRIESSDNKSFIVGSTCIKKTGDKGLIKVIDEQIAELKREQLEKDYNWAMGNFKAYKSALIDMPHSWRSDRDMYNFIQDCESGIVNIYQTTKTIVVRAVKKAKKIMGEQKERPIEEIEAELEAKKQARAEKWKLEEEIAQYKVAKYAYEYNKAYEDASKFPHPNPYFAKRNKTLKDYLDYMEMIGANMHSSKVIEALKITGADL